LRTPKCTPSQRIATTLQSSDLECTLVSSNFNLVIQCLTLQSSDLECTLVSSNFKSEDCKAKHCMTMLTIEDTKVHSKSEDCKAKHCMTMLRLRTPRCTPSQKIAKLNIDNLLTWSAPWCPQTSTLSYNVQLCNLLTWSAPWCPQTSTLSYNVRLQT
jgi:hypothetical protein